MKLIEIPTRLPTSWSIPRLFQLLSRGAPREATLRVRGRTMGLGTPYLCDLPVHGLSDEFVPAPILTGLEARTTLEVSLPWFQSGAPTGLSAAFARWHVPRVFRNPTKPSSAHGRQWLVDVPKILEFACAASGFSLPPTALVVAGSLAGGAGDLVAAMWLLESALNLSRPEGADQAERLLRRLAQRLGAEPLPPGSVDWANLAVPIPGSPDRESATPQLIAHAISLGLSRRYPIAALEEAIKTPAVPAPSPRPDPPIPTVPKGRRRAAQEASHEL